MASPSPQEPIRPPSLDRLSDRSSQLVELAAEYKYDPLGFCQIAWPWGRAWLENERLRPWQEDLFGYLGERLQELRGEPNQVIKAACATGHDVGKSAAASMLIHWALATCANTRGLVTANKEDQLRNKTWPELTKWHQSCLFRPWFKLEATSIHAHGARENLWKVTRENWAEHNPEAFQGLHNKGNRLILVFDESSAIARTICEATEGSLTDEYTQILWILLGNPTRNEGYFYDVFHKWKSSWWRRHIDSRDVEGTNKAEIQEQVDRYGEDSDFVRVRVRGQFPRVSDRQFIGTDLVELAQTREATCRLDDPFVMGVDVARGGDAKSVICFRKGFDARTHPWIEYRGRDTEILKELTARIIYEAERYHPDMIFIDGDGVGAGVYEDVKLTRWPVIECRWGRSSPEPEKYGNMRAYAWARMKEWLRMGGAIDPRNIDLAADLTRPEYHWLRKSEALVLTSKDDMDESTDDADALAATMYYPVAKHDYAGGPEVAARQQEHVQGYDVLDGPPPQHVRVDTYAASMHRLPPNVRLVY